MESFKIYENYKWNDTDSIWLPYSLLASWKLIRRVIPVHSFTYPKHELTQQTLKTHHLKKFFSVILHGLNMHETIHSWIYTLKTMIQMMYEYLKVTRTVIFNARNVNCKITFYFVVIYFGQKWYRKKISCLSFTKWKL